MHLFTVLTWWKLLKKKKKEKEKKEDIFKAKGFVLVCLCARLYV